MGTRLLWFDDDGGRDVLAKVRRAVARYEEVFSQAPRVCYVHPSALDGGVADHVDGVRLVAMSSVMRHHFLVGRS